MAELEAETLVDVSWATTTTLEPEEELGTFFAETAPETDDVPEIWLNSWHSESVTVIAMQSSFWSQLAMHDCADGTSRLAMVEMVVPEYAVLHRTA